jgi:hypothetical protein
MVGVAWREYMAGFAQLVGTETHVSAVGSMKNICEFAA